MDVRPALRAHLLSSPGVTQIAGDRIYHMQAPEGEARPLVVMHRISETDEATLTRPSGLAAVRVQIDAWATERDTAEALATEIRRAMLAASVRIGEVGFASVVIFGLREGQDADTRQYFVGRDYLLMVSYVRDL